MNKHYIWIKTKCLDYYKFITKVNNLRIRIEEIKYEDKIIYLRLEEKEYEKIKKYLLSYKFSKVSDLGLYKAKEVIRKYKELFICLIIGLGLFSFFSCFVLQVNVIHESKEIRELILDELDSYGIKRLSLKKSYAKLQEIKQNILDKYPDRIDWLEFEVDGMIYNIRVEERIITDISKENKVCHVIAKKSGTISGIKLYHGEMQVGLNDYVKEGDILISGLVKYNDEIKAQVCASGEVYANTWYTVSVSIPFNYNIYEKTGKNKYNIVIDNDGNKKKILKKRFVDYNSEYKTIFDFFGWKILLEKEMEIKKINKKYSEEEALAMGLQKAEESLLKKLNKEDEILDKKVLKKSINDSKMDIEVFIVVNELISTEAEVEPENIEGNDNDGSKFNKGNNE